MNFNNLTQNKCIAISCIIALIIPNSFTRGIAIGMTIPYPEQIILSNERLKALTGIDIQTKTSRAQMSINIFIYLLCSHYIDQTNITKQVLQLSLSTIVGLAIRFKIMHIRKSNLLSYLNYAEHNGLSSTFDFNKRESHNFVPGTITKLTAGKDVFWYITLNVTNFSNNNRWHDVTLQAASTESAHNTHTQFTCYVQKNGSNTLTAYRSKLTMKGDGDTSIFVGPHDGFLHHYDQKRCSIFSAVSTDSLIKNKYSQSKLDKWKITNPEEKDKFIIEVLKAVEKKGGKMVARLKPLDSPFITDSRHVCLWSPKPASYSPNTRAFQDKILNNTSIEAPLFQDFLNATERQILSSLVKSK